MVALLHTIYYKVTALLEYTMDDSSIRVPEILAIFMLALYTCCIDKT